MESSRLRSAQRDFQFPIAKNHRRGGKRADFTSGLRTGRRFEEGFLVAENPRFSILADNSNGRGHSSFVREERERVTVSRKSVDTIPETRRRMAPISLVPLPQTKEKEYVKNLRPSIWLTEQFPLKTEELLPLLDILANKVKTVRRMREIIEAMERMLPNKRGLLPCDSLFEMLKSAIVLEASNECKNGFEMRIGKQLDEATVEDLLIPSRGYAKEEKYDTECVRRILKNFYHNCSGENEQELITVAELVDNFLIEIASDIDLNMGSFMSLAELSCAASEGILKNSDGIYRAIDIYLDKHRYLTESEREEICRVLDCNKMSHEARFHAAQNERLPLRVVVQVLFVGQLQLRDSIPKEDKGLNEKLLLKYEEEEEEEGEEKDEEEEAGTRASNGEEEVRAEIEKMESKVLELERECHMMRREIQNGGSSCRDDGKKRKVSIWKEMKRKFGCMTSIHDSNCHVKKKKVHPR